MLGLKLNHVITSHKTVDTITYIHDIIIVNHYWYNMILLYNAWRKNISFLKPWWYGVTVLSRTIKLRHKKNFSNTSLAVGRLLFFFVCNMLALYHVKACNEYNHVWLTVTIVFWSNPVRTSKIICLRHFARFLRSLFGYQIDGLGQGCSNSSVLSHRNIIFIFY